MNRKKVWFLFRTFSITNSRTRMCILFTYSNADPLPGGYKLILASNRDEYYARPASPAAEWSEDRCIVGGLFVDSNDIYIYFATLVFHALHRTRHGTGPRAGHLAGDRQPPRDCETGSNSQYHRRAARGERSGSGLPDRWLSEKWFVIVGVRQSVARIESGVQFVRALDRGDKVWESACLGPWPYFT